MITGINASGCCWHIPPSGPPNSFLSLTKSFKPGAIRVPGGTLGNFSGVAAVGDGMYNIDRYANAPIGVELDLREWYDRDDLWRKRYGVNAQRRFMYHIIDTAKATAAKVLWVASVMPEGLDDTLYALSMFQSSGVHVIGIELGNEWWLPKYGVTVEQYIDKCRRMKDGLGLTIKLSMCLKIGGGKRLQDWNDKVIASGIADAYAVHMYQDDTTSLNTLLGQFDTLRSRLDKPVWITEFGSQRSVVDMEDLESAYRIIEQAGLADILCVHNLIGDGPHGLIKEKRGWFGGNSYSLTSYGRAVRDIMVP